MANPFMVVPGNQFGQGLQSLAGSVERFGEARRAEEQANQQRQGKAALGEAVRSGDPAKVRDVMVQYPELQKAATEAFGFTNEQTRQVVADTYRRALSDPDNALQYMDEGIQQVANLGGSPMNMIQDYAMLKVAPENALKSMRAGYAALANEQEYNALFGSATSSNIGKYNPRDYTTDSWNRFVQSGDPGVLARYETSMQERLASDQGLTNAVADSQAQIAGEKAGASEAAKLTAQAQLKPEVERAVTLAKEQAKQVSEQAGEKRSNSTALRMYDSAMGTLAESLSGTSTGPVSGFLPALTTNAQIAEGAVATMAPILKQMFRTAGEGTFTDKDQEMLLKMIPTRSTHPEAREAQIKAIDAIVRAKLNQPEEAAAGEGTIGRFKVRAK